jgi:multiple sugar transport system permease protein
MTAQAPAKRVRTAVTAPRPVHKARRKVKPARVLLHVFLSVTALVWLIPLLWAVYTSLRPYQETASRGFLTFPKAITGENYANAWQQAEFPHYFWNSILITVPAVLLTLFFAAGIAFFVTRFSFRFNLALLMLFTAGNLLPPQALITPLFQLYLKLPLPNWMSDSGLFYNSAWGVIAIHVAFQCGFCTFVLSNYMRTIPHEITEAALVDGAPVWRQFFQIILPLCRPAFAALATLESIWIYNDFFWALVLFQTGSKRPITSAIANLSGEFFTNPNLVAAGALMTAIPTLILYFLLQKQFVAGLTLGSSKG